MTPQRKNLTRGKCRTLLAASVLLALAYVGAAALTDKGTSSEALRQLGQRGCSAVLALSAINYLLRFYRWQYYLAELDRTLPQFWHLLYYLSGFAFTVSPAKAGEAIRAFYLKDHGVTYTESIATLFVERLLDLMAIVALAAAMIIDRPAYQPLLILTATVVAMAIISIWYKGAPTLLDRLSICFGVRARRLIAAVAELLRSSRQLLHPRTLLFGFVIGLTAWGAEGLGFWLICESMHIPAKLSTCIGIYALAVLAGSAAFIVPAGIGGLEIAMTSLLVAQGAILRTAILATLLCRLATLWFAVLVGAAAATIIEVLAGHLEPQTSP